VATLFSVAATGATWANVARYAADPGSWRLRPSGQAGVTSPENRRALRAHLAHVAPGAAWTARRTSPASWRNVARPLLDDGGFSPKFSAFLRKRVAFGEPNLSTTNFSALPVNAPPR
jgi:hypothetical protein